MTKESQGVLTKSVDDRLEERQSGPRSREARPGGRGLKGGSGGERRGRGLEGTRSKDLSLGTAQVLSGRK